MSTTWESVYEAFQRVVRKHPFGGHAYATDGQGDPLIRIGPVSYVPFGPADALAFLLGIEAAQEL